MDGFTDTIVSFVDRVRFTDLPPSTIHAVKRRLVDSVGCACAAIDSSPAQIARQLAAQVSARRTASVIGMDTGTSVELATFANTVMGRHLDFNDGASATGLGGGHPSDTIHTSLAVGEALSRSGAEVLTAIVISYQVQMSLINVIRPYDHESDQGLGTVVAAAMAAGKLMGLNREQLGHAVALAITPNIPTRQSRTEELSMWKGCATAAAARSGVVAAELAQLGMTGPTRPFEGRGGLFDLFGGLTAELEMPYPPDEPYLVERTALKCYPADYESQAPIALMLSLRDKIAPAEVDRIVVETYRFAVEFTGNDPEKWDPKTRETADHSMPFLLAAALIDGEITMDTFTLARVRDESLRPLMKRISLVESKDFTDRYPKHITTRIRVYLRDGTTVEGTVDQVHGTMADPLSDEEIDAKFSASVSHTLADPGPALAARRDFWSLEKIDDIHPAMALLTTVRGR
jgi:2-methylcitrate dehydratase